MSEVVSERDAVVAPEYDLPARGLSSGRGSRPPPGAAPSDLGMTPDGSETRDNMLSLGISECSGS